MLLKRSKRTRVTVDYPEGMNIHKTHRRPTCPKTMGLLSATPGPPAAAVQLRLAADAAQSQLEIPPVGRISDGAQRPIFRKWVLLKTPLLAPMRVLKRRKSAFSSRVIKFETFPLYMTIALTHMQSDIL